jgi:hypothetical protein
MFISNLSGVQRAKPFAGVRGVPEKLLFPFLPPQAAKSLAGVWGVPTHFPFSPPQAAKSLKGKTTWRP